MRKLLDYHKMLRKTFVYFPCCSHVERLGSCKLITGSNRRDWMEKLEDQIIMLEDQEKRILESIKQSKEMARTAGRNQAEDNTISLPLVRELGSDIYNTRIIGTPVDYVIFKAMESPDIEGIVFLDKKENTHIKQLIADGKYQWEEIRMEME